MALVVESTQDSSQDSNSTSFTMTKPTGVANDDLLVAVFNSDGASDPSSSPSGWTAEANINTIAGNDSSVHAYYKVITNAAGEPATYQWDKASGETWYGTILRISGADTTTPMDATAVTSEPGNTSTPTSPSITTVTNNAMLLAVSSADSRIVAITSNPSGMTGQGDVFGTTSGTGRGGCAVASEIQATAGASGTKSWTLDTSYDCLSIMLAIRPDAAGASIPASRRSVFF